MVERLYELMVAGANDTNIACGAWQVQSTTSGSNIRTKGTVQYERNGLARTATAKYIGCSNTASHAHTLTSITITTM